MQSDREYCHSTFRPEDFISELRVRALTLPAILREARYRAKSAGAGDVEEKAIVGAPVDALVDLAAEVNADLLVVGNVGLSTIAGRLLGSVPANVARRSKTDVLIVHTS